MELRAVEAVPEPVEAHGRGVERWARHSGHEAVGGDDVAVDDDRDAVLVDVVVADGREVDERLVREVEQVVVDQLGAAGEVERVGDVAQPGSAIQCVSGTFAASACAGSPVQTQTQPSFSTIGNDRTNVRARDDVLRGHPGADAVAVEREAVVAALDRRRRRLVRPTAGSRGAGSGPRARRPCRRCVRYSITGSSQTVRRPGRATPRSTRQ